jgi:hypothetical protein
MYAAYCRIFARCGLKTLPVMDTVPVPTPGHAD